MGAPCFSSSDHSSVLDFLNTVIRGGRRSIDALDTDDDVAHWLRHAGYLTDVEVFDSEEGELSERAKSLREILRELVTQRKAGRWVEVTGLNALLALGSYRMELESDEMGDIHMRRRFAATSPYQLLMPVAVAAADLLARGDFRLIRQCEGDDCPLWFYDRTKAHRRRRCNRVFCGNRRKAARAPDLNQEPVVEASP
jgi:predicted RNA-binding Zn ribbon-like protein